MIKLNVKIDKNTVVSNIKQLQNQLDKIPQEAYNFFVKSTPKDTGNARRSTKLKGDTIEARYPYATRLNEGWSKQAPDGMVKPTEEFIKQRLTKIIGK